MEPLSGVEPCGYNVGGGAIRHNVTSPLASIGVSVEAGTIDVYSAGSVVLQYRPADVERLVPMTGSVRNPVRSGGLALKRRDGSWDYIWCGEDCRQQVARLASSVGFLVEPLHRGIWVWSIVFGKGVAPRSL